MLGAYLVLYPGARVTSLVFLGFFYQLVQDPGRDRARALVRASSSSTGSGRWGDPAQGGGVAFFAHIGGFVFGAVVALVPERRWAAAGRRRRVGVG